MKSLMLNFNGAFLFRDAEDAVRERDGYDYDGYRLRVEFPRSNGSRGGSSSSGSRSGGGRGGGPKPGVGGTRRTSYRVYVSGKNDCLVESILRFRTIEIAEWFNVPNKII